MGGTLRITAHFSGAEEIELDLFSDLDEAKSPGNLAMAEIEREFTRDEELSGLFRYNRDPRVVVAISADRSRGADLHLHEMINHGTCGVGTGSKVVAQILEIAKRHKASISLFPTPESTNFWKNRGFRSRGDGYLLFD
jgi:hypothetical protein